MPRTGPFTEEHKTKISLALKAYRARPDAHETTIGKKAEEHPNWQGGVRKDYYTKVALDAHGDRCVECGAPYQMVHHRDHNRRNSDPQNVVPMCFSCHMQHHHGKRVDWRCTVCGAVKSLRPFEARTRVFCSRACKNGARNESGQFVRV